MKISDEEQIEAYIKGKKFELAQKYCQKETLTIDDYKKVFNISKEWTKEYVLSKYQITDLIKCNDSPKDGFYAIKKSDSWLTFRKERNIHFDEVEVNSESEVWDQYIEIELGII